MADRTVAVRLRAVTDTYKADLLKASQATKSFSREAAGGFKSVTKAAANLGPGFRLAAAAGLAAMGAFAVKSIKSASDLNETLSKTQQLFGANSRAIEQWSSTAAQSMGQSKKQAMDAAASFAVFGRAAGLSGDALVKFSEENTQLASDMASFFNTSPEDAITAIGSAFRGEQEPIRAYGVLLDDATLRNEALRLGLTETTKNALTPQQRVLAAQSAIMKQTAAAQGDFARTSGGLANQQRILAAELENTQAELGQALLPAMLKVVGVAKDAVGTFNGLPEPLKLGGIAVAATAAGFVLLAPRIVETVNAMKALSVSSPAVVGGIGKASKALAAYAAVAAIAATRSREVNSDTSDMASLLTQIATSGEGMDRLGYTIQGITKGVYSFNDAVTQSQTAGFMDNLDKGFSSLFGATSHLAQAENSVRGVNDALVEMVRNGSGDAAAKAVDRLRASFVASGGSVDDFNRALGPYFEAVRAASPPSKDLADAQARIATKADIAKAAIKGVSDAVKAWQGLSSRSEAADNLAAGFDDLSVAVAKNKGTLSGNTTAAREARAAFRDSMGDIAAYAETFKNPAKKAAALQTGLDRMRSKLDALNLSDPEIARLLKPYVDMANKAKAAAAQQALIARNITITTTYTNRGQAPAPGHGGRVITPASGGLIVGPGTKTSDSIPARVSNGEYVVRAASVDKYGVDFLHALNSGSLPAFAKGGKVTTSKRAARRTSALERLASLRSDRASAIESTASSMRSSFGLMGSFDFGAQARAIDDLAAAQGRLADASSAVADADQAVYDARRAVNSAGSASERASAEKALADALKRQAEATGNLAAADQDVAAAKTAVKRAAPTAGNVLAAWRSKMDAVVRFNKNLKQLRAMGFSASVIAQIASDPDGAEVAQALVKATPAQVKSFNHVDRVIAANSQQIAVMAGNAQYAGRIAQAQQQARALGATTAQVGAIVQFAPSTIKVQVDGRTVAESLVRAQRRNGKYVWVEA